MQNMVPALRNLGATLVALTPQQPAHSLKMVEAHKLDFELLSDPENAYAAALGLRFALPPELREIYRGFGIDLPVVNGDDSWTLPMPGRIVVDVRGVVRAVEVDPDYTHRPEPEATLREVERLSA